MRKLIEWQGMLHSEGSALMRSGDSKEQRRASELEDVRSSRSLSDFLKEKRANYSSISQCYLSSETVFYSHSIAWSFHSSRAVAVPARSRCFRTSSLLRCVPSLIIPKKKISDAKKSSSHVLWIQVVLLMSVGLFGDTLEP